MKRNPNSAEVQWSIRLSAVDKQAFKDLLPIHGSAAWFIETSLRAFIEVCDPNDGLQDRIHHQIQVYLNNGEDRGALDRLAISIPADVYQRFNDLFPEKGAASWFVRHILAAIVPELQAIAIQERVETAVRNLLGGLT